MKFTHEANVVCGFAERQLPGCAGHLGGAACDSLAQAMTEALGRARAEGWLQIGEDIWCGSCATQRGEVAAIDRVRSGRWVPMGGMAVRFLHPGAGRIGDVAAAAECRWLVVGKVYRVRQVRLVDPDVVMVGLEDGPGLFFNCEQFEPAAERALSAINRA